MKILTHCCLLALFTLTTLAAAQGQSVIKLKAHAFSYKEKETSGYWADWSEDKESSVPVVVDYGRDRMSVYGNPPHILTLYA